MAMPPSSSDSKSGETMLGLLNAIENQPSPSQRDLAQRLGIALGLTNALLKRFVKKGLLKVKEAPSRRYMYYITPRGFSEKTKLTRDYLYSSMSFFRRARQEYVDVFESCRRGGKNTVVLVSSSELAEIAILAANQCGLRIVGVIDSTSNQPTFHGVPIFNSLQSVASSDKDASLVLCEMHEPQSVFDRLVAEVGVSSVLAPPLLHVTSGPEIDRS